ncbi:Virulence-associated protein E [Methylorubrum extorquens]|uniref:Virulence-associated protein E n=1 Tax=Methylorubrum extorquens TaxID=408 RepID=A0A2N9ASG3_METEX|nr:Virulence-associated protein E [Methylorubrum extorquens]
MMDLRTVAHQLGGEVSGQGILCPGPGHSARDRSLSVMFSPSAPGGFLVFSHAGDEPLVAKDFVRQRLGLSLRLEQKVVTEFRAPKSAPPLDPEVGKRAADRSALALRIWREARSPAGTPVESYLARRGLGLPDNPGEVLRYHDGCPFAGTHTPAMVALVRNIRTDRPQAIHRTALTLDGHKIKVAGRDRAALGPITGGAVKWTPDAEVTTCLGIGEGIESTASLQHLSEFGASPIWSVLNEGGISAFPALAGIECLWIAVDHDPAGDRAARACAGRWRTEDREVFAVKAKAPGSDLNDILQVRHV